MESSLIIAGDEIPLKLFVYGTLLKGYCNNFLVEECKFIGKAMTVDKYSLFVDGYPYVNTVEESKTHIVGELYEVTSADILNDLDMLESHPDYYVRSPCRVQLSDSDEIVDAQIYFNNRATTKNVELVTSGDYRNSPQSKGKLQENYVGDD